MHSDDPKEPSDGAIKEQLVEHFLNVGTFPLAMHFVVGCVVVAVLGEATQYAWLWLGGLAAALSAQAFLVCRCSAKHYAAFVPVFAGLNACIGLLWGVGAALFLSPENLPNALFYVFVTGGLSISSVATQHMFLRFCMSAIGIAYAVIIAVLLWQDFPNAEGMAVLLVLFCFVMFELARRLRLVLLGRMALEAEKDQLLADLEESLGQLRSAQTDRARYLAQASHDLRQPLHAASLLLETAKTDAGSFDQLRAAITNLVDMFDGLMDLTLLDQGRAHARMESVALGPLLTDIATGMIGKAEAAGVSLRLVEPQASVHADPALLRRILLNLMGNAIRHAPGASVLVGLRRRKGKIFVQVIDQGPGLAEADQSRIFGEFVRLPGSDQGQGLGLGLSIVRGAARAMGARCDLMSRVGHGSCFSVGPFELAEPVPTGQRAAVSTRTLHVTLLDDAPEVLNSMVLLLKEWGHEVTTARHPTDLDLSGASGVLILDNELGGDVSGIDLLEQGVFDAAYGRHVIMISGTTSPELDNRTRAIGVPLLSKPVRPAQLRSALLSVT